MGGNPRPAGELQSDTQQMNMRTERSEPGPLQRGSMAAKTSTRIGFAWTNRKDSADTR